MTVQGGAPQFLTASDSVVKSKSVFGNTSYLLADRLTLGAGVRYETVSGTGVDLVALTPFAPNNSHTTDPRFYLDYKVVDGLNLYSSAAKGFDPGGINGDGTPFAPEVVWTYEFGLKTSQLAGRLNADAAVFYSDYNNYQVLGNIPAGPSGGIVTRTSNAGTVKTKGVEWNVNWRALEQWLLGVNGNYLWENKFTQINAASATYDVGDPPDGVPKYSFGGSVERDFTWATRAGYSRLDFSEIARESYRNRTFGPLYFGQSDVIRMLNFHAGLNWNENLRFGILGRNLLNDRGYTSPYAIENNAGRSRPRTYGLEFGVTFH